MRRQAEQIRCKGRDDQNHEVLAEPVSAQVYTGVNKVGRGIYTLVNCPYMQSDGHQCNASEIKKGICPSALDLKVFK